MGNNPEWLTLNKFLRHHFGCRVQKIPLDAGLGCPNRDGTRGRGGCIYCDARGSGTGAAARGLDITTQMKRGIEWAQRRYKARMFMPYFQAFSNTWAPLPVLEKIYSEALAFEGVAGITIGTRPDCVSMEVLDLIKRTAGNRMVWMEYGLQSASDTTLRRINRGHTVKDFITAVKTTHQAGFLVCAHVIFGLPGQSHAEMMDTVDLLAELGIDGIKFHNLYILPGTRLREIYFSHPFRLPEQEEYAELVADSIRRLPQGTVIQRITGDPPAWAGKALPAWAYDKQGTRRLVSNFLKRNLNQAC